jgi:hypothetical protein
MAVAEFEREIIREGVNSGLRAARALFLSLRCSFVPGTLQASGVAVFGGAA